MEKLKYRTLANEMKKKHVTKKDLARILGITRDSVRSKMYGTTEWKGTEMITLMGFFNLDFYILFQELYED